MLRVGCGGTGVGTWVGVSMNECAAVREWVGGGEVSMSECVAVSGWVREDPIYRSLLGLYSFL